MANDNPYQNTVTQLFGDDGDSDLRQSLIEGMKANPDTAAKALPFAEQKKIPLDMAERNLPELEADKKFSDIDFPRLNKESPMLGDFLRDRENARIAHDDIPFLDKVGKTLSDVPTAILEGQSDVTLGKLREKQLRGVATPEEIAQADSLSQRARPEQLGTGGFFSNMVTGVAGQLPILAEVGKQSMAFGLAGAGTMAVAGQLGPQVAAPEEVVTVPAGFIAGAGVGAFNASRQLEAGLAYDEFLSYKDANGNGVDPDVARGAATIVGLANGALELIPLKKLVKTMPGADKLTGYFTKNGIKEALKIPGVKDALGNIGKNYAELIISEGATEVGQEAVTMYLGELTKAMSGGEFQSPTGTEQLNRLGEAGKMGMTVAAGLGLPGTVINTGRVIAQQNKQPDPQVVQQYLKNARDTLADPNGKLPQRSLAKTRDYLNRITGGAELYVDGDAVQTFYQSLDAEQQAQLNAALPDFAAQMQEAVTTKGDMAINRADYFTYVQPLDTKAWLDENARFMPEHFSAADVAEYDRFMEEVYGAAQDMIGQEQEAGEIVQSNFYNQLLQRFGDRTQPSGKNDVAKILSENPRAFYETMLDRTGNTPEAKAVLDRLVRDLQIVRPVPESLGATMRRDDFDLMIDRARNQITGKGKAKEKPRKTDMFGQSKPKKEKATPTPLINYLISKGGIERGSPIQGELEAIGITPQKYPRLYRAAGQEYSSGATRPLRDIDGFPLDEMEDSLGVTGIFDRAEEYNGYVSRNELLDKLRDETFGNYIRTEEQTAAEQDAAYMDDLIQAIGESGADIETASNAEIKVALERLLEEQRAFSEGGGQVFDNPEDIIPPVDQSQEEDSIPFPDVAVPLTPQEQAVFEQMEQESENPPEFQPEVPPAPIEEQKAAELPKAERPAAGESIEDFGEKILGARKDEWQSYKDTLTDALPEDAKDITLSKHFPEPNYEHLIAAGVDPKILGAIKAIRDEIPNKPQKAWRLKQWGQTVKQMREFSLDLLEGGKTWEKFQTEGKRIAALEPFFNRIDMYADLGYPLFLKAKGWDIHKAQYSMYRGQTFEPAKIMWSAAKNSAFGEAFDTRDQAIAYVRAKLDMEPTGGQAKQTKLDIYQVTKTKEIIIGKKVGAGKFVDLKGGFATVKEARAFLKENEKPLLALLEKKKQTPPERRSTNDPRQGEDYRLGENISPEKFANEFGFRGVQFGNYVEQARRATDLNNAYDAMLDMARILDVPSRAVSLNGTLGLAFGARGKGGKGAPAAHYENGHVVINLTKAAGPGSLAHEWWHAMDNFFGKKQKGGTYLSANPRSQGGEPVIRPEVVDAFKGVMQAIYKTDMKKRSKEADKTRSKDYWSTDIEMSARAFEAYIIHKAEQKNESNDYLANITGKAAWDAFYGSDQNVDSYPYPTGSEMVDQIAPAFDKLFQTLETRETDKGVELFQDKGGKRGSIRFTPTGKAIISLFEKEDLSTVLHELGHLYWKTMTELAVLPSASEQLRKDVDTMRAWVGAKPLAQATEPLTVEQEEKIADGFLAYLREGKAPSVELQTAFSRFKGWLMRLYRGIRDTLPGINKEVREVFDRMLATDDAIEALGRQPVFQVDQAIMNLLTKSEAARMQNKMDRAVEEAKARLYKKALKQSEQRNTAIYKEARAKLEEEVTASVNDERVYRAMDAIKEAGGLSRKALVKGWGKEILPYMSGHGGLVAKSGGADPQAIAGLVGYTNSREMIGDIMNAPKKKDRINQLVEDEMLARYGDMLNDGTIEAEALEQMHNDLRAEVLEMEMEILSDLAGIPAPTKDGIKAKAIQIMAETKVKDIMPNRRLRAENRAYYDYGKALGKKDYVAAARAKAQQLLNHHLYGMSVQAQRTIDKKMQAWRRLLNKSDEKIGRNRTITTRADGSQTAGPDLDYVYAARAVLAKYGIGRSNYDFETFFANLRRDDPDAADTLLQAYTMLTEGAPAWEQSQPNVKGIVSRTAPYKNLVWADFQALSDAVDNLIEVGKNQKFIELNGQKVAKEQALDELKAAAATHKDAGMPGVSDKWERKDKLRRSLWGYRQVTTRVERFVKDMDRGYTGTFRKYFWEPVQSAVNAYREDRKGYMKKIVDLLEPHKERLHGEPIEAPELTSSIDGKAYTFEDKAELIGMLAHTGNGYAPGSNGYKLLVGNGWATFDEDGNLDTTNFDAFKARMYSEGIITKEDMDLVQSLWEVAESMKPAVWKAHKKMYGFYPDSVTSVPIMTPFGEYKGGYWPAIVDKTKSRDANTRENRRIAENENNITAFPTTGRGATKGRIDNYAAPLEMSLRLLPSHVDWALRFVHIEPTVKDSAKLLLDKELAGVMERVSPGAVDELLFPWLQRVARQSSDMPVQHRFWRDANAVAAWGRRTTGVLMMAGNTVNIAMQFTGFAPLAYKAGYRNMGRAWLQWVKNPNEMARIVNESSVVMRNATASFLDTDYQRKVQRLIQGETLTTKLEDLSNDYGYIGQKVVQNLINNVGWIAAYNQAYGGQAKGIEAGNEQAAVNYADTIVSETQGFNNPENIANIEAQTALGKLFLVFYSFFNNQGNFLASEAKMIANKDAPVAAKAASAFHLYLMCYMIPSFLADIIGAGLRGNLPDDDDEDGTAMDEWFQFFLISQFKYAAATVPYVGQALNYVISKFTPQKFDDTISVSPVFSVAEKALSAPFSLKRAMFDDGDVSKAVGDVLTAVGTLPGMGFIAGFTMRPAKWLADLSEGDSTADDAGDVIQGLASGRSSKE